MQSESARVTTAAEAAFRISSSNSQPRCVKVVATDATSDLILRQIASLPWNDTEFFTRSSLEFTHHAAPADLLDHRFCDIDGRPAKMIDAIDQADLVVMLVEAGSDPGTTLSLGARCASCHVSSIVAVLKNDATTEEAFHKTVVDVRRSAGMIAFIEDADEIRAILTALRA